MELGPRDVRVLLWVEDSRLYILWQSAAHWDAIRRSLKETFPRHSQLSYDAGRHRWSMPLTQRAALERWAAWTFAPGVVEWVDEEPVSFSRHARRATSGCKNEPATRVVSGSLLKRGEGCHSPSGAGVTNRSSTVAVPRSSTVPDRKDGPHSDDSFIIAPAHEGYMLRASRVCDALEVPMSHDNQSNIPRVHSHHTLADSSRPAMKSGERHAPAEIRMRDKHASDKYTANVGRVPWRLTDDIETAVGPRLADPFVDHLDGVTSVDFAARAETAATWLARAHPELHAALHLVTVEGLSHREAGRRLGLTHRTVGKRVDAALMKVRARCMAGETAA